MINLVRNLSHLEHKYAWKWQLREFNIIIGNKVMYLYNNENKLLTASPFTCQFDELNSRQFAIKAIQKLTTKSMEEVTNKYDKLYKVKEELWNIYRIPITDESFYKLRMRWIRLRKKVTFLASVIPNPLGYYFAEIKSSFQKENYRFLNDNSFDLLLDLFFALECFIGREEIPFTFSQAWYEDYKGYSDRRYPEAVARYNVEQTFDNYIFDKIINIFPSKTKTSFLHIHRLFRQLGNENKYYVMNTLLNNDHFRKDENDYVIYTPTLEGGLDIR